MKITRDCVVLFRYNFAEAGEALDAPGDDEAPLAYIHGRGQMLPGLEQALEGHEAGAALSIQLPPEQAYGERDESRVEVVEREYFAGMPELRVGLLVQLSDEAGKPRLARVVALDTREVKLDTNHPYAGKTLDFRILVVAVRSASEAELASGQVDINPAD